MYKKATLFRFLLVKAFESFLIFLYPFTFLLVCAIRGLIKYTEVMVMIWQNVKTSQGVGILLKCTE